MVLVRSRRWRLRRPARVVDALAEHRGRRRRRRGHCVDVRRQLVLWSFPGFTEDDYRLSAAWDRPPATELATIGLALSLDLLPLLELARPAPARLARVIVACFTVHGIVTVAATPMSKMRGEHALSTLAFLLMLAAYQALVVATVPKAIASKPLRDAYEPDVRQLRGDLSRFLRVFVLGAVWRVVLAVGGGVGGARGGLRGDRGWGCRGGVMVLYY